MNWPADAEVGVVAIAISCSIRLKMGSLLISAVLCIQVPVLISSSCFLRHRMHTHIICNVIIIICQGYQYIIFMINQCCQLKILSFYFLLFFPKILLFLVCEQRNLVNRNLFVPSSNCAILAFEASFEVLLWPSSVFVFFKLFKIYIFQTAFIFALLYTTQHYLVS